MTMNTKIANATDHHNGAVLSLEDLAAVSGGIEAFPNVGNPLYVKIAGRWVPTGTEPFIPVDLDGKHTP
jgi:hypothetical protein